ncbi:MAG: hypothetical protein ILNGONEN_00687 [Syntrophorhabdaceae bacterium]|nr:hypothetical protein [Syntrophorhabdaceae bacterium]
MRGIKRHVQRISDALVGAEAAYRSRGGPAIWIARPQLERAAAAHARAGQVNPPVVDPPVCPHIIHHIQHISFGQIAIAAATRAAQHVQLKVIGIARHAAGILDVVAAVTMHNHDQRISFASIVCRGNRNFKWLAGIIHARKIGPFMNAVECVERSRIIANGLCPLAQPKERLQGAIGIFALAFFIVGRQILQVPNPAMITYQSFS